MSIQTKKRAVESNTINFSPDEHIINMGISAEAMSHIVERLTDLYGNTLESFIRELISNAQDASIGISNNIDVFIDEFRNEFVVKDYGTGMSMEDVVKIYSQYGASTKAEDMKAIGAFGLGGKSPLAYTNSFMVTTIKNGKKIVGIVEKTEEGPKISILSESDTKESNGTEIRVQLIDNQDVVKGKKIINRYEKFSEFLEVKINNKEKSEEFIKSDVLIDYHGIGLELITTTQAVSGYLSNKHQRYNFKFLLEGYPYDYNKDDYYSYYLGDPIYINLKPGLVDFNSSRESVIVNERSNALVEFVRNHLTNNPEIMKSFLVQIPKSYLPYLIFSARTFLRDNNIIINNINYSNIVKRLEKINIITSRYTPYTRGNLIADNMFAYPISNQFKYSIKDDYVPSKYKILLTDEIVKFNEEDRKLEPKIIKKIKGFQEYLNYNFILLNRKDFKKNKNAVKQLFKQENILDGDKLLEEYLEHLKNIRKATAKVKTDKMLNAGVFIVSKVTGDVEFDKTITLPIDYFYDKNVVFTNNHYSQRAGIGFFNEHQELRNEPVYLISFRDNERLTQTLKSKSYNLSKFTKSYKAIDRWSVTDACYNLLRDLKNISLDSYLLPLITKELILNYLLDISKRKQDVYFTSLKNSDENKLSSILEGLMKKNSIDVNSNNTVTKDIIINNSPKPELLNKFFTTFDNSSMINDLLDTYSYMSDEEALSTDLINNHTEALKEQLRENQNELVSIFVAYLNEVK